MKNTAKILVIYYLHIYHTSNLTHTANAATKSTKDLKTVMGFYFNPQA